MLRRVILAIPFWLAIGAAITLATSWAIAAWMPLVATSCRADCASQLKTGDFVAVMEYRGIGWSRKWWEVTAAAEVGIKRDSFAACVDSSRIGQISGIAVEPWKSPWGRLQSLDDFPESFPRGGCEHATGWPFCALWYEFEPVATGLIAIRGGSSLIKPPTANPFKTVGRWHALPFRPIWREFALNSIFWGLVGWTIALSASRLRRVIRFYRNHCPRCNYDLSASPTTCPECGWNRPATPATPSIQT